MVKDQPGTSSGRVELRIGGRWGPVMRDFQAMTSADWQATVGLVCRTLGFASGAEPVQYWTNKYGRGSLAPLLSILHCDASAASLEECSMTLDHGADAAWGLMEVECS